jgi:hypothetical protein
LDEKEEKRSEKKQEGGIELPSSAGYTRKSHITRIEIGNVNRVSGRAIEHAEKLFRSSGVQCYCI